MVLCTHSTFHSPIILLKPVSLNPRPRTYYYTFLSLLPDGSKIRIYNYRMSESWLVWTTVAFTSVIFLGLLFFLFLSGEGRTSALNSRRRRQRIRALRAATHAANARVHVHDLKACPAHRNIVQPLPSAPNYYKLQTIPNANLMQQQPQPYYSNPVYSGYYSSTAIQPPQETTVRLQGLVHSVSAPTIIHVSPIPPARIS